MQLGARRPLLAIPPDDENSLTFGDTPMKTSARPPRASAMGGHIVPPPLTEPTPWISGALAPRLPASR